jgi:hypothetical protein
MKRSHKKLRNWFANHSLGMNWIRDKRDAHTIIWHNGRTSGCRCFLGFIEGQATGIVLLTNSQAKLEWFAQDLLDSLVKWQISGPERNR